MPDDSNPQFKASQSKHARKIEFERGLMEMTGLTRNQVRGSLRNFNERIESRLAPQSRGPVPTPVVNNLPRLGDEGAKFEPRPFATPPISGQIPAPQVPTLEIPEPPASGDYVLVSEDGELSWEEILECE